MALEIVAVLVEAAVSLAQTAWDDNNVSRQEEVLNEIAGTVTEIKSELHKIRQTLEKHEPPPPEVARFRRAREKAQAVFLHHWDQTLLDFGSELLAMVLNECSFAVKISVCTVIFDADTPEAIRSENFETIVQAKKTVAENAERLAAFFQNLLAFNNSLPIPRRRKPSITLSITRGNARNFRQFDLMKNRVTYKLLKLSTLALGWRDNFFGFIDGRFAYNCNIDREISKRVEVSDLPHMYVMNVSKLMRKHSQRVEPVLKQALHKHVSGVRIIVFSEATWIDDNEITNIERFTIHVRSFYTNKHVRCLEFLCSKIDDWDRAMMRTTLLKAVSGSAVAFRFANPGILSEMISESTNITSHFEGITAGRERILYIYCSPTSSFGEMRKTIQNTAIESGLPEPYPEDILFEQSTNTNVLNEFWERARKIPSIVNKDISGTSREVVEAIVRILNDEIDIEEAKHESLECVRVGLDLKARVNSQISIDRENGMVVIKRGDFSGYGGGGAKNNWSDMMKVSDYKDFRSVNKKAPHTVKVCFKLSDISSKLFEMATIWKKWPVVKEMERLVNEGKGLYLTVIDEKVTKVERWRDTYVTAVDVTIAGGDLKTFLHMKLLRKCLDIAVLSDDSMEAGLRCLLELIPKVARVVYPRRDIV